MEYAAQQGDIDTLYNLIEHNPRVLEEIDSIPFVETPLHVAVRAGHAQFVKEIVTLKPSFSWKFNPQGFRPVHLALQRGDSKMVYHLIKMDKELVRAKMRGGLNLLHLASTSGYIELLPELLKACPDSIKDLTARNETALHLYERFKVLEFLLRWLETNTIELQTILNQRDVDGNTVLHIAATRNDNMAMKLLIKVMTDVDAANLMNQTACDIINNQEIINDLVRAKGRVRRFRKVGSLIVSMNEWVIRKTGMKENMSDDIRNMYMIVATLIATTTYQAVLSPPGGFHQIDATGTNNTPHGPSNSSKIFEGKSVMQNFTFLAFSTTNMCAFITSILAIILMMPRNVGWCLLYLATSLLLISYYVSMMVISPNDITKSFMFSFYMVFLPVLMGVCVLFFKVH